MHKETLLQRFTTMSIYNCAVQPRRSKILWMKITNLIQLSISEISLIAATLQKRGPCHTLIFGLGNDSLFWHLLNQDGHTVFLENNLIWYEKVISKHPQVQAHVVQYNTYRSQWQTLLANPATLNLALPVEVTAKRWDVILVDAPNGWRDNQPGRMKSIYMASKLIRPGGDVFVHDCNRKVEQVYASTFLGDIHLTASIGRLRHFHMSDEAPSALTRI